MNVTEPETFRASVFKTIADRFQSRALEIERYTRTRYSFEEWLNWEAFAACSANPGWQAQPKPSYCKLGVQDCKDYGDLLIVAGESKVLVEIGLVHDGTGDKWRGKLDWDVQKLARNFVGAMPLQIIVLVSTSNIDASESWQRWLAKVPCWGRETRLTLSVPLPPVGTMLVRGWV